MGPTQGTGPVLVIGRGTIGKVWNLKMPRKKVHKYFFGENPQVPGKVLIWSGDLAWINAEDVKELSEIIDSLKLEGLDFEKGLCYEENKENDWIIELWFKE